MREKNQLKVAYIGSVDGELTTLLQRWAGGDRNAGEEALERSYAELRRLAAHYLSLERPGHTLQPTALVHEMYLRLERSAVEWADRKHFFVVVAGQMRRILVDHARARAARPGGGRVDLGEADRPELPRDADLLALDEALERLRELDERAASAVELRYFGGFTEAEAASILGVSVATLKRDWEFARAWLLKRLE
jgi:RNA polymerase sigma-70 factor, ECF subfamily